MTGAAGPVTREIAQLVAELKKSGDEDRVVAQIEDVRRTLSLKIDEATRETAALRRDLNGRLRSLEASRERAEGAAEGAANVRDQVFKGQQATVQAQQQTATRRFAKWGALATLGAALISTTSAAVAVVIEHLVR